MIITALNYNKFYFEQLLVLLTSIKTNSSNDKCIVFLIDFPKDLENKLKAKFTAFEFVNRNLNVNKKKNIAGFMVCYRSLVVKECLEKYKKPVAWFDTDIIVRGQLTPFWDKVETNQFKILYRGDDQPTKNKFQAGIFAVGYSKETVAYISEWNDKIQTKHQWYADQRELYVLYKKKYFDKIELIKMPISLNDVGDKKRKNVFDDKSTIWHCKKHHFKHEKFRKEYLEYLNTIKGEFNKWL